MLCRQGTSVMALNYLLCLLDLIGRLATRNADNLLLRGMYGRRTAQVSPDHICHGSMCMPLARGVDVRNFCQRAALPVILTARTSGRCRIVCCAACNLM